ncbi:MAG: hypothetical protein V3U82_07780 [Robiginitomaculum sp.]
MPDRIFYPVIIAIIAAIIAGALFAGGPLKTEAISADDIRRDGFSLSGEQLRRLVIPAGTAIDFAGDSEAATRYAVLSAFMTRADAPSSAGIFAELNSDYETVFSGQKLRITLRARAGRERPSERFTVNYYTVGHGDSGAQGFTLGPEFTDYSFEFTPRESNAPGVDYIGIWPDVSGQNLTMDVESISVIIISP